MKGNKSFKRLVSALVTLTMVLTIMQSATLKQASAADSTKTAANFLNETTVYLHLGNKKTGTFDFNIKKSAQEKGATYNWYVKEDKGNPNSVTIDKKTGFVTAKEVGTAYIRCKVTLANSTIIRPEAKVIVRNNITEVKINNLPKNMTITAGEEKEFKFKVLNTEGGKNKKTDGITRWEISNDTAGVENVTDNGIVFPTQEGNFKIRAVSFQSIEKYKLWIKDKKSNKNHITAASDWYTIKVEKSNGTVIVNSQERLNKVLAIDDFKEITLSTKEAEVFKIEKGNYSNKTLIVNAPNSDVNNYGIFKQIYIKAIKATTWIEYADGNIVYLLDDQLSFVIDSGAHVKQIVIDAPNSVVNLEIHGVVDAITIMQTSQVNLSGTSKNIPILVKDTAEGSGITTSISLNLSLHANSNIVLNQGAENSKIDKNASKIEVKLHNKTKESVLITTNNQDGVTIESGKSSDETTPTAPTGGGGSYYPPDNTTVYVTGVSVAPNSMTLTVGNVTGKITASIIPSNATNKNVTWSSSNPSVATVENGLVTPLKAGTAIITVKTVDGNKTASCTVEVVKEPVKVTVVNINVVDGVDGFTPVTVPVVGQVLRANITLSDGTIIGTYPVNKDAVYKWYYAENSDTVLGTEASYTVTTDNIGKTICADVSVIGLGGIATWIAQGVVAPLKLGITNVNVIDATTVTFNSDVAGAIIKWNGVALDNQTVVGMNSITVPLMESGINNELVVELSGFMTYVNRTVNWKDPFTYKVSSLGEWVNDRTEPDSWSIDNDWISYSTKTAPSSNWYAWHGKKTTTDNAVADHWKVETEFDLTEELLTRNGVRTSIWLNITDEYGHEVDWSILQFKIDEITQTKGWQYWDSNSGKWIDIATKLPTSAGVYKIAIYYSNCYVVGYINGIEVFQYAVSESGLTSVKEVIFNSYSFGESYEVKWKVPTLSYVERFPIGTKFISNANELGDAIANQTDGETWIIAPGVYDLDETQLNKYATWNNPNEASQGGWYFPIYKSISIIGDGSPIITSTVETDNGIWSTQDFISIWADNVLIDGIIIESKSETNKSIEVLGKDVTIRNVKTIPKKYDGNKLFGGSIYFNTADVGNATLENVELQAWILAPKTVAAGIITLKNVIVDFRNNVYADYVWEGTRYQYGVISKNNVFVNDASGGLIVKVDNTAYNLQENILDKLPSKSRVELEPGIYYYIGDTIPHVASDVTMISDGVTFVKADKVISTVQELSDAIKNQADNQTWIVNAGTYGIGKVNTTINEFIDLTANNLKIIGVGNPVIYGNIKGGGVDNFISVRGDNTYIEGITFMPMMSNTNQTLIVHETAPNFTIKNSIFKQNSFDTENSSAGALYMIGSKSNVLIENNIFEYACLTFDSVNSTNIEDKVIVRNNNFKLVGMFGISNVTWTNPATLEMQNIEVISNNFNLSEGSFAISNRMNDTNGHFVLTANTINNNYEPFDIWKTKIQLRTPWQGHDCPLQTVEIEGQLYQTARAYIGNKSYSTFQAAIDAADAGDTINLTQGTFEITKQIDIIKSLTIIGAEKGTILKVITDLGTVNGSKHAICIFANEVKFQNMTIDSDSKAFGLNAVEGAVVTLDEITIQNSKGAGLTVNGSNVTATNLNTNGNAWGAVNVDPGSGVINTSRFELFGNGILSENYQIWSDGKYVSDTVKVYVSAEGYNEYMDGGITIWSNRTLETLQ